MATTSSVAKDRPDLGPVFGSITDEQDRRIRGILLEVDENLLALARHFELERAGWEGTGLDLFSYPSGQVQLSSFVEPCDKGDGNHSVSFCIELAPVSNHDDSCSEPAWDIELEVYADCQHKEYCGSMHLVHDRPAVRTASPIDAALALRDAAEELLRLGKETPLASWLLLASDDPQEPA